MKRSPLRRRSLKRTLDAKRRTEIREQVLRRDFWTCRAAGLVLGIPCGGPLDVHEVIPRSAWRAGWLVVENCLTVCRIHHDWIGDHPVSAHELGLHGYSWERPA